MKNYMSLFFLFTFFLTACGGQRYSLIRKDSSVDPNVRHSCLICVVDDVCRERDYPRGEELKGRDTIYFLWWGSLTGPKLIAESAAGKLEQMSSPPFSWFWRGKKRKISDGFVTCLLSNGYVWAD